MHAVHMELHAQILDLQQRVRYRGPVVRLPAQLRGQPRQSQCRLLGSTASRTPSPTKFHAMMARKMQTPGNRIHGKS